MRYLLLVALLACGKDEGKPKKKPKPVLPAGPTPVALAKVEAAQLRTLTSTKAFIWIDAKSELHLGNEMTGKNPYEGEPIDKQVSAFFLVEEGRALNRILSESGAHEADVFAVLTREPTTHILVLADAATPAWITHRFGIEQFHYRAIALAAGAANTAVPYRFGEGPWEHKPALVLHTDRMGDLGDKHPASVMLEYTDATTTGELVTAIAALGAAGTQEVRVHRMMGWGEVPPGEIVDPKSATSEDDVIVDGPPSKVTPSEPKVDNQLESNAVEVALKNYEGRFRYCYEKAGRTKPLELELAFDVAKNGAISNAVATGSDKVVASCVAGAVFDLDLPGKGIKGGGHASAKLVFTHEGDVATAKPEKVSGFWCWTLPDGSLGRCTRYETECASMAEGYNQVARKVSEPTIGACTQEDEAWQLRKDFWYPTKAICAKLGSGCKRVR